jgi:TM2 domain-containing membrane protein YozV
MPEYYYADGEGQPIGPYSSERLREMLRQGTVAPTTLVLEGGKTEWIPCSALLAAAAARSDSPLLADRALDMGSPQAPPAALQAPASPSPAAALQASGGHRPVAVAEAPAPRAENLIGPSDKSMVLTVILWFLSGLLPGLHYFYLGQWPKALVVLLLDIPLEVVVIITCGMALALYIPWRLVQLVDAIIVTTRIRKGPISRWRCF